eukprot:scaffold12863_cov31-Tisochrysis_lutea.AAC.1
MVVSARHEIVRAAPIGDVFVRHITGERVERLVELSQPHRRPAKLSPLSNIGDSVLKHCIGGEWPRDLDHGGGGRVKGRGSGRRASEDQLRRERVHAAQEGRFALRSDAEAGRLPFTRAYHTPDPLRVLSTRVKGAAKGVSVHRCRA